MKAQTVVLDSHNLEEIVKDATGEGLASEKPVEKAPEKVEAKKEVIEEDKDDVEGEDGLTERQKRELTAKMQAAIGKKHRALKDAEEFATEQYNERRLAEQRAEMYQNEVNKLKTQLTPKEPEKDEGRPVRESFKTEEEFRDALDDWRVEKKFKIRAMEEAKAKHEQIVSDAQARIARAVELVPDYEERIKSADYIVPAHVAALMQVSPLFAELGLHFAEHPEDLARLAILPNSKLELEFRKFEGTLTPFGQAHGEPVPKPNGKEPTPPKLETAPEPSKPRAPAPITPLSTASVTQVEKPEREMDAKEALAAYQKRKHVNLTRRQRH